jgi:hypothetical protein
MLSGYDFPNHRDWLAWTVLVIVIVEAGLVVRASEWWSLLGVSASFVVYGWVLSVPRDFVRGYRGSNVGKGQRT